MRCNSTGEQLPPDDSSPADRREAYLSAARHVLQLALATFGVALLMGSCAWLLGHLHGKRTAFHDALDLLLHYPAALPAIMAFTGASLLALAACLLAYPFAVARWVLSNVVVPSLQTAEHMLTLALGLYFAWVALHADDSGVTGISSIRGIAASSLAVLIVTAVALACSTLLTWIEVDLPNRRSTRSPGALVAFAGLVLGASWLYADLVWLYDAVDLAH
jgi:hypothetical protein